MKLALALALAPFLLAAAPAAADDKLDCAHAEAQQDMNRCAEQDFERADAVLNRDYKKLLAGLDAPNAGLLRTAQRAWLSFRDSECKFEAAPNTGGSIYPLVYSGCLTALTKDRTKQLKQGQQ